MNDTHMNESPGRGHDLDQKWHGLARTVRPTLIVGLGGTGMASVKTAAGRIHDFLGTIPQFVAFRGFDTAFQDDREPRFADNTEYLYLGGFNAQAVVSDVLAGRAFSIWKEWLPPQLNFQQVTVGAGGIRPIGRLCYFYHRQRVELAIRHALATITNQADAVRFFRQTGVRVRLDSGLDIHLVFSVCGGTGAGMFLDLAFDLRRWAEQVTDREVTIFGHIVLPEAFRRKAVVHRALEANAYCGLQELDHFMNEKEPWRVQYTARKEPELARAPFDHCFLLNGLKHGGSVEIETLTALIGETLMLSTLFQVGQKISEGVINMAGQRKSSRDEEGNLCAYSSYGVLALELPREFLRRSLGAELAQKARARLFARTPDAVLSAEEKADWKVPGFDLESLVREVPRLNPEYSRSDLLGSSNKVLAASTLRKVLLEAKEMMDQELKVKSRGELWPTAALLEHLRERLTYHFAREGGLRRCHALIEHALAELEKLAVALGLAAQDARKVAESVSGRVRDFEEGGRGLKGQDRREAQSQWETQVRKSAEAELLKHAGEQLSRVRSRVETELLAPWSERALVLENLRADEPLDEEAYYRVNRARMSVCPTPYFSEILRPKLTIFLDHILARLLTRLEERPRMTDREINQEFGLLCQHEIDETLRGESRIDCQALLAEYYGHPSQGYEEQITELLGLAHANWEVNPSYSLRQNLTEISAVGAVAESKFYEVIAKSHAAIASVDEEREDYLPILRSEHGLSLAGIKRLDDYEQSLQQAVFEEQRFDVHFFNHRRWARHMRFASETAAEQKALYVFSMAEACELLRYEREQRSYLLTSSETTSLGPSRRSAYEWIHGHSDIATELERKIVRQEAEQERWKQLVEKQEKALELLLDRLSSTRNGVESGTGQNLSHLDIYQLHAECRALLRWLRRERMYDAWS